MILVLVYQYSLKKGEAQKKKRDGNNNKQDGDSVYVRLYRVTVCLTLSMCCHTCKKKNKNEVFSCQVNTGKGCVCGRPKLDMTSNLRFR